MEAKPVSLVLELVFSVDNRILRSKEGWPDDELTSFVKHLVAKALADERSGLAQISEPFFHSADVIEESEPFYSPEPPMWGGGNPIDPQEVPF